MEKIHNEVIFLEKGFRTACSGEKILLECILWGCIGSLRDFLEIPARFLNKS